MKTIAPASAVSPAIASAMPARVAPNLEPLRFRDLKNAAGATVRWVWRGYLAAGHVTLLTSQWKTGKSTLLSVLMAKMKTGGSLAGLDVAAGRVALVTEESVVQWRLRGGRLRYGSQIAFFCRPFCNKPSQEDWLALVDRLVRLHAAEGLQLVAIDTLASFLPKGAESQVDLLIDALKPLERLTAAGAAVLLVHHPRKGAAPAGQAARGSGALGGFADILVEMKGTGAAGCDDRRRRLSAWSRFEETPRDLTIALSNEADDYAPAEPIDGEADTGLRTILEVLKRVERPLSRDGFVKQWPEKHRPSKPTLWRWLDRGVARDLLTCFKARSSIEPHTYGLKGVKYKPEAHDTLLAEIFER